MSTPGGLVVRRRAIDTRAAEAFDRRGIPSVVVPRPVWRSLATFCVATSEPCVAITYDDGPHPRHTPAILDVLAQRGARATFFVLAGPAQQHPDIVRRIAEEGHEVGLHGADHTSLLGRSTREVLTTIRAARRIVERAAGKTVRLYRPPYGRHSPTQARAIDGIGLETVVWSNDDARDWVHDDERAIAERAAGGARPGAVLLLHDDRADAETERPEAVPAFDRAMVLRLLLDDLAARGLSSVTVSDLLARGPRLRTIARERMRP